MPLSKILFVFTRTSLHVGAGESVSAIDQPVQRERHTGLPIIPGSTLKGSFADHWEANLTEDKKKFLRVETEETKGDKPEIVIKDAKDSAWLFGSNNDKASFTGAIQFGEARLLAFPIRSAKGSFAWITSPIILRRALRDAALKDANDQALKFADNVFSEFQSKSGDENVDEKALFTVNSPLAFRAASSGDATKLVLEEYTFTHKGELPVGLGAALQKLLHNDPVWTEIASRLVILSDGMMSFFAQNACEVAEHVRISDETGTAIKGGLFNQENVPSETLFYSVVHFFQGRSEWFKEKSPLDAVTEFSSKLAGGVFQFGGDASTGLGFCSLELK